MRTLEEMLYYITEEERREEKTKKVKVEGSKLETNLRDLSKILAEVIEEITNKDSMLCEEIDLIDKAQMECIKQLGDILETIRNY